MVSFCFFNAYFTRKRDSGNVRGTLLQSVYGKFTWILEFRIYFIGCSNLIVRRDEVFMSAPFSKAFLAKKFLILSSAIFAWNCSSDSDSGTGGDVNLPTAECDLSKISAQYPIWTGAYFIYADGSVTDGANAVGVFDFESGNLMDAAGTVIGNIPNVLEQPYFDGTHLIYRDCSVKALDGSNVGIVDEGGNIVPNPESSSSVAGEENPASSSSEAMQPIEPQSSSSEGISIPESSSSQNVESSSSATKPSGSGEMDPSGYEIMNYASLLGNGKEGWSSRYWDACKPHCSWPGNVDTSSQAVFEANHYAARNCNIHDYEIPAWTLSYNVQQYWKGYQGTTSACSSDRGGGAGGAFTCTDMAPVAVNDTLAYAFVAAPGSGNDGCGKCYHIQFNGGNHDGNIKATHKALSGKHMVVMASNIGHDVEQGQFDMMVPGGGVGQFDALSTMVSGSNVNWGAKYGGFLTECQKSLGYDNTVAKYQSCIKSMCDAAFTGYDNLLRGCHWFADWYMAADNPTYNWEEVECPQYLIDKYMTTINRTISTDIAWQDDWSSYTGGDFETKDCDDTGCP